MKCDVCLENSAKFESMFVDGAGNLLILSICDDECANLYSIKEISNRFYLTDSQLA